MDTKTEKKLFQDINILDFVGIILILIIAFYFQFRYKKSYRAHYAY